MDKRLTRCAVAQRSHMAGTALQILWEKAGCGQNCMFNKVLTVIVDTW